MCARAARLLGEGDQQRKRAQRERLERTLTTLLGAPGDERLRVRAEAAWQTRFEDLLEDAERSGRQVQLAAESRQLVSVCAGAYAMAKPVGASAGNLTSPGPSVAPPPGAALPAPVPLSAPAPPTAVPPIPPGKTQLAAHFVRCVRHEGTVDLVVWVTVASRGAVVCDFAAAAGADPGQPEHGAQAFLAWLRATGRRWLVVLDGLTDPAELHGLWPPERPGAGHRPARGPTPPRWAATAVSATGPMR
ncbi:hypothetical protein ABT288_26735 [Streptomyces sp. NPDC001093]|uniref:hypothetical protein n=1 Tax=Streptomyces sp. NPDC001093 TaxID=3154376 RepID=UPI0033331369